MLINQPLGFEGKVMIKTQTHEGAPISVDSFVIKPVSLSVSWISRRFGFVWNRPFAVKVEAGDTTYRLPIRDYTQIGLTILWGLTAIFVLMAVRDSTNRWRKSND